MAELSRRGVCKTLNEKSPYLLEIKYGDLLVTYYFSSEYNKNKFNSKLESFRNVINESLSKRFKITINYPIVADIKNYFSSESRGFLISCNGKFFRCPKSLILDGEKLMNSN